MNDSEPLPIEVAPHPDLPPSGLRAGIATLHPAYFALVMASGIASIASHLLGFRAIGAAMFSLNVVFYALLCVLTILRAAWFAPRMLSDLLDHGRCVGFFTTVAGTCVLGSQCVVIASYQTAAACLWSVGVVLWVLLTYVIFTSLTVKLNKPPLAQGINGGWLVAVVAAQSVSVLGTQLAPFFRPHQEAALFFTLSMWFGGGMLYIWIISLIFYRYTFFPMEPSDISPPYWINMGAMAILTLVGTMLITASADSPLLRQVLPFLKGFTLFFWSTASWWIPCSSFSACGGMSPGAFPSDTTPGTGVLCSLSACTQRALFDFHENWMFPFFRISLRLFFGSQSPHGWQLSQGSFNG